MNDHLAWVFVRDIATVTRQLRAAVITGAAFVLVVAGLLVAASPA